MLWNVDRRGMASIGALPLFYSAGRAGVSAAGSAAVQSRYSNVSKQSKDTVTMAPATPWVGKDVHVTESRQAAPRGVSSGTTAAGRSAGYALAKNDCGPAPPGAQADANGNIHISKDPAVLAWRACDMANQKSYVPPAPLPPSGGGGGDLPPGGGEGPYAAPGVPYPSAPDGGYGIYGGGASSPAGPIPVGPGGAAAASAGPALDQAGNPTAAAAPGGSSTGIYVAGGVALVAAVGLYLALR